MLPLAREAILLGRLPPKFVLDKNTPALYYQIKRSPKQPLNPRSTPMSGLFNKLPGFQQTPAGAERVTLRRLPRIAWVGTLLLLLPSLLARLAIWFGFTDEGPGMPGMVGIRIPFPARPY